MVPLIYYRVVDNLLERACLKWGMKINVGKCKVISTDHRDVLIGENPTEKVNAETKAYSCKLK